MCYLKNNLGIILLVGLFVGLASTAFGQMKTVDVDFEIKEQNYRLFYGDSIGKLEVDGAKQLALRLQQHIPFIVFSDESGEIKMTFTINRQDTGLSNPFIHRIDLHMGLTLTGVVGKEPIAHGFRSEDRFNEPLPSTNEAFLQELDAVLDFWLDQEKETIVREVFSQISLGAKAHPDPQTKAWVMPFSQDGINIGKNSEFRVLSKIQTTEIQQEFQYDAKATGKVQETAVTYPSEYRGNILATLQSTDHLDVMGNVQIEGIYLIKFRAILPDALAPDDADLP